MSYHFKTIIIGLSLFPLFSMATSSIYKSHGYSLVGKLKYSKDFNFFDYVNPNAPKKGVIKLMTLGAFNTLNPFNHKGLPAPGADFMYDTLMVLNMDEPESEYGLIAKSIEYPEDTSWVVFNLRKFAHFSDGKPLTAKDVVFTYKLLITKENPVYKGYFDKIKSVQAESPYRVRFKFKAPDNAELIYDLGLLPILPKHYWQNKRKEFSQNSLSPPLGSGPYKVYKVKPNHSVTYQRDPSYWAKDLAVNLGSYNFDTIKYEYYGDDDVAFEAFKAGEYDARPEFSSKKWATGYPDKTTKTTKTKKIIKISVPSNDMIPMTGFIFNTRNALFANKKVRKAISLLLDFEWANKHLFYSRYKRIESYFTNSEFSSKKLPSANELKLLASLKGQIPNEVFSKIFEAPKTRGDGKISDKVQKAYLLLKESGWQIKDGTLKDRNNNPFRFTLLLQSNSNLGLLLAFKKNLAKVGIHMALRVVDLSQYFIRLKNFDYDMLQLNLPSSYHPGVLQRFIWSSQTANIKGSPNLVGTKNPALDKIITKILAAKNHNELVDYTRALDRVLLWNYYVIPAWYDESKKVAYWNNLAHPKLTGLYDFDFTTWWAK